MTNWRNNPSVMEKFRAIRLDDTMSDELELAALLDLAVAASGSPPSPTRHQVVLLGAHSGRSIAGALIPATATTLYVRQDEVLALFDRASSGSTGAPSDQPTPEKTP